MHSRSRIWIGCWITLLFCTYAFCLPADDLRLIDAIKNGDRAAVRSLIEQRVNVNAAGADGATALAWAVNRNDTESVELLITAGANVNAATDYGVTPLSLACTNRNAVLVERLLKARANPGAALWTGETPLLVCARTGDVEAVNSLLSHGADPNVKETQQGHTALMRAVAETHADVVETLVKHGADVRVRSKGGFTALLFAAQQGDIASARTLLAAGADINEAHPVNGTALVVATASFREKFAVFLLENGANPNAIDAYGLSALHYAIPRGIAGIDSVSTIFRPYEQIPPDMPELVRTLLARGANPNAAITKDFPPYSRSPYALGTSLVGVTPFLLAAAAGNVGIMNDIVRAGADPKLPSKDGSNALMFAAGVGRVDERENSTENANALEAVKLALKLGNDINAANTRGRTALHGAAGIGGNDLIEFLVKNHANLEAKDRAGYTPADVAAGRAPRGGDIASRVYEGTEKLLVKLGAKPFSPPRDVKPND